MTEHCVFKQATVKQEKMGCIIVAAMVSNNDLDTHQQLDS